MGYQTRYSLHTVPPLSGEQINELGLSDWDDHLDPTLMLKAPEDLFDGDSRKWYEHDDDMLRASTHYPEVVFILDGEGEDFGDIWRAFYRNGEKAEWRPTIDPPKYSEQVFEMLKVETSR